MSIISLDEKKELRNILKNKHATLCCHRCGGTEATLLDGYFKDNIYNVDGVSLNTEPYIKSIMIICDNCGALTKHALGLLKKIK